MNGEMAKKKWPPWRDEKPFREVTDVIHGSIPLYYPVNLIIDTPEFQRLRYIKQLGVAYSVYPNCDYCRFAHCLGVYHLARLFVRALAERRGLNVSPRDELCVAVAGLCHDLGHGPFSHLFDAYMVAASPNNAAKWKHEQISQSLFRRICDYRWVRDALLEYLEPEDLLFIEELIDPPEQKFSESGEWLYRGRGVQKSFLYDIVSNSNDSFDVDKYDYLLRDSYHAAVAIPFNQKSLIRILDWMRPLEVVDPVSGAKFWRIAFAQKISDEVLNVAQSRCYLHDRLYSHHFVRAYEHVILDALVEASSYLKFQGDDGRLYPLSHAHLDLGAYIQTDDSVIQTIEKSREPELENVRKSLQNLKFRRVPKLLGSTQLSQGVVLSESEIKERLLALLVGSAVSTADFFVNLRSVHRGLGLRHHPMNVVLLYNHKMPSEEMLPFPVDEGWLLGKSPTVGGSVSVNVYVAHDVIHNKPSLVDEIFAALNKFAAEFCSISPVKRINVSSGVPMTLTPEASPNRVCEIDEAMDGF